MVRENLSSRLIKFVFSEFVADILYWPVWWYTTGLKAAFARMQDTIHQGNEELALSIWLKNIFKPMFGQYDWQGRIISFFMRLAQIIFRLVIFLFWIIISLVVFLFWLILPLILLSQVFLNLGFYSL
ncbi:MAG: hypothetical protein AAB575_04120 [Patescibacteria group bacterium]